MRGKGTNNLIKHGRSDQWLLSIGVILGLFAGLYLTGCGSKPNFGLATQTQSFGQVIKYNTQVDMLVVVDTSQSMATKQNQLANQFAPFIDAMVTSGFDFRIAVTTMDMSGGGAKGAFVGNPKVLSKTTPNLKQAFINNVMQGTNGSDLSRGLEAMAAAFSDNMLNTTNAGFWRPQALLSVIFLSDEEDGSAHDPAYYQDFLDSKKPLFPGDVKSWLINSIVVKELSQQCTSLNQFASAGYRFMELSDLSGGAIESICNPDLTQASRNIHARIVERLTQYHLDVEPNVSTIQVFIDGRQIPNDPVNGWTYDPRGFTITFHGTSVPGANSKVQVSYKPVGVKT